MSKKFKLFNDGTKKFRKRIYLIAKKINGKYKKDVDDVFNAIFDFIENRPYEVFDDINSFEISVSESDCSIKNSIRDEVKLLIGKPTFYCQEVIFTASKKINDFFDNRIYLDYSYKKITITFL